MKSSIIAFAALLLSANVFADVYVNPHPPLADPYAREQARENANIKVRNNVEKNYNADVVVKPNRANPYRYRYR